MIKVSENMFSSQNHTDFRSERSALGLGDDVWPDKMLVVGRKELPVYLDKVQRNATTQEVWWVDYRGLDGTTYRIINH